MFDVRMLPTPETVPVDGGVFTLTHQMERMILDPRNPSAAVEVRKMKGYLDKSGAFVDFGAHEVSILDAQGLADLMADTTSGKPAGDFRLSDIAPAITKRAAEKEAAKAPKA